jgi:hypothetical protein
MRITAVFALGGLVLAACGPKVKPAMLETEEPAEQPATSSKDLAPGRGVLVGEMCPEGAAGKPAVAPLLVRAVGWTSDAGDVGDTLDRSVHAFAVLGLDGKRAGVFEVLGAADAGLAQDVAIGGYVGRGACVPYSDEGGKPADPACEKATKGCGLAVAQVDPSARTDTTVPELTTGGACVSGDALVVDVDGDGAPESFALATFLDPIRAPADEVLAAPVVGPSCTPTFSIFGHVIRPPKEDGPDDARYHVTIDLLGVVDLDADGRHELVLAFRYPESRTLAVYSALHQAGRLELVGEAVSWP